MDLDEIQKVLREKSREYLSDSEFNELLDKVKRKAIKVFDGDDLAPCVFVYHATSPGEERVVSVILIDPEAMNNKQETLYAIGNMMATKGVQPIAIFLACTGWMSKNPNIAPSKDPNRTEAVIINGCTIDHRSNMVWLPIHRYPNNVDVGIGTTLYFEGDDMCQSSLLTHFYKGYSNTMLEGGDPNV